MKINYLGRRDKKLERDYEGRFTSFKRKAKSFFRKCMWLSIVFAVGYGIFTAGGILQPRAVATEVIIEVDKMAPILQRIAKCESGGKHLDKNGQVLMRSNTNKSVDVGRYQINTVWFAKATELGFDLTTEQGNESMAMWIYKNRGTGDWSASQSCWKQ